MSSLPFTTQQCFFVAIFVFVILGFQRGWRRELVLLVFVLVGVLLANAGAFPVLGQYLLRVPAGIGFLLTGSASSSNSIVQPIVAFLTPWGSLPFFGLIVALGYLIGNRVFPKPGTPVERLFGIIPAVISGALILYYLSNDVFPSGAVAVQSPNPGNYIPVILIIALAAVIVATITSRAKKAGKK